jgi:PPOX class probable F420-dependent enzyme
MKLSKKAETFLKEPNICVLSTTGPGDWPHAIPMWYLYEDGEIIITTSHKSQKHLNVVRTGKASIVVDQRTPPYYALTIRGDARVGPGLSHDEELRVAARYLGEEGARRFMERFGPGDDATIRIRPRKCIEYHGIG